VGGRKVSARESASEGGPGLASAALSMPSGMLGRWKRKAKRHRAFCAR